MAPVSPVNPHWQKNQINKTLPGLTAAGPKRGSGVVHQSGTRLRDKNHGKQSASREILFRRIALSDSARRVKGDRRAFPARTIGQDSVDYLRRVGRNDAGRRERPKNPRKPCAAAEKSVEISPVT